MAIRWQIPFKSLRSGSDYCVNIIDSSYSGSPIPLKGGASPFTTDEEANEDPFTPIRTQSGYLRIIDDGKDANGNTFDWKQLIAQTDTSRPVTLTRKVGTSWVVQWQGFMQAQNFGHTLYGDPQEMEFPVQCCVSVLNSMEVSTEATELHNFAWIIYNFFVTNMPQHAFTSFVFQGGYDAQSWLLKKIDWQTFLNETEDYDLEPAYSHYEVLEDVCRFWGWTCRTKGQTVYFTCMDDSEEQSLLTMTQAQLQTMAGGTNAGSITGSISSVTLSGDIFANTNNDDYQNRGPNKATVKASIKEHDTIMKVFPTSVENYLENLEPGWQWVQGEEDLVGYFETPQIGSFGTSTDLINSQLMQGYNNENTAAFSKRQIFTSTEADDAAECDMILINRVYDGYYAAAVQTKKAMSFCGGSLKLSGTVYFGSRVCDWEDGTRLRLRLGIGANRQNAQWWYMPDITDPNTTAITCGWTATLSAFYAPVTGGNIQSTGFRKRYIDGLRVYTKNFSFDAIPVPANRNLHGLLFVDILGLNDQLDNYAQTFQIADFKIEFSRDTIVLPTTVNQVRGRTKAEKRTSSKEYTSGNPTTAKSEWNADCIIASDNHMVYGFGLLMNDDGSFCDTVQYANNQSNKQHPEQHLANRVTSLWTSTKRRLGLEVRTNAITEPAPTQKVTVDSTTFQTLAISHDWRDDVTKLTLLQL